MAWKMYLPIHAVPTFIFKYKLLKTNPLKFFWSLFKNIFKSCLFLATYICIYRYSLCLIKNFRRKVDRSILLMAGCLSGVGLLWEPQSRRTELALYFLPRVMETLWRWLKSRKFVTPIPNGEIILFAFAMSVLMYCYENEKHNIKNAYLSMFTYFWGEN